MNKDKSKTKKQMTKGAFLKLAGVLSLMLLPGIGFLKRLYAAIRDYILARLSSTYAHDLEMELRKPQENPQVAVLYNDFLGEPNSEMSHSLLHTEYTDRSADIQELKDAGYL